ncbi:MAG: DUF2335 domain-containing protein [Aestuariivita sp.]|nr:DUF2335 domain-containing protein [Aestuariivita sp.]MCY4201373.1 DUF2335 domain-containing protein [Aestuariivita sp.]
MKKQPRQPPRSLKNQSRKSDNSDQINVPNSVLENLPKNTQIAYAQASSFRGPIPPPALFEEYEKIQSGMADRIMKMAEGETLHRHSWEMSVLDAQKADIKRATYLGFVIVILSLGVAGFCAFIDQQLVAIAALSMPLGGTAYAF